MRTEARTARGSMAKMSSPSSRTVPVVGVRPPAAMVATSDFPEPGAPVSTVSSPGCTVSSTSSTKVRPAGA